MTDISAMDKDALAEYAKAEFNIDLDLRRSLANLQADVAKLQKPAPAVAEEANKSGEGLFLMNIETDIIFPWSELLEQHLGNKARRVNAAGEPV